MPVSGATPITSLIERQTMAIGASSSVRILVVWRSRPVYNYSSFDSVGFPNRPVVLVEDSLSNRLFADVRSVSGFAFASLGGLAQRRRGYNQKPAARWAAE